jgi:hypothetical protein
MCIERANSQSSQSWLDQLKFALCTVNTILNYCAGIEISLTHFWKYKNINLTLYFSNFRINLLLAFAFKKSCSQIVTLSNDSLILYML